MGQSRNAHYTAETSQAAIVQTVRYAGLSTGQQRYEAYNTN